jgi:hypothetical protein
MMREFEVRYREQRALTFGEASAAQAPVSNAADGMTAVGPIQVGKVTAEVEREAREVFSGFFLVSVRDLGPVIEPWMQWLNIEQACKYLGCSKTSFYDHVLNAGRLPRPKQGDAVFARKDLDRIAVEGIGKKRKAKTIRLKEAA